MTDQIDEWADENSSDDYRPLRIDGMDDCVVGYGERCSMQPVLIYDTRLIISSLCRDGMDEDEAWEWFSFNIAGAWMGEGTPIFLHYFSA
jgi:hypothetical protein